ncbi:hypothetical protein chiPu_0027366 [Chiloscyllium punctatum]|uniref:Uncharacterized protein n=1 Tax=Chiloscyllium punctatum TaxID=137246 RepID=A0A401TLK0_CHIPU|nr:hypothetical protein [Chiloscyllium punctatum]
MHARRSRLRGAPLRCRARSCDTLARVGGVRGGHMILCFASRKSAERSRDVQFCGPRRSRDAPFRGQKKVTWGQTFGNARRWGMESDQQPMRR